MNIVFVPAAWEDFTFWLQNDPVTLAKITELIKHIRREPFTGVGKPEPLKNQLQGCWSRRITGEHRLVYQITGKRGVDQQCTILQCRYHYSG